MTKTGSSVFLVAVAVLVCALPFQAAGRHHDDDDDSFSSAVVQGAALGALLVAAWILNLGTIPVWCCGLAYGIIGIEVGRNWPAPSCCCFNGHLSGGDSRVCCPLLPSCITLLVFQTLLWIIHVIILALGGSHSTTLRVGIVTQLLDLCTLGVLIAAIVLLTKGYSAHGNPNAPGDTYVTVISAGLAVPMAPVSAGVPVAAPAYPETVVAQK